MEGLKFPMHLRTNLLPGEDPADFEALAAEYYRRFAPIDVVERSYVNDMICTVWSIRRVHRFVAELSNSPRPQTRAIHEMRQILAAKERGCARVIKQLQAMQRRRQHKRTNTPKRGGLASFRHHTPALCRVPPKTSTGEWIH